MKNVEIEARILWDNDHPFMDSIPGALQLYVRDLKDSSIVYKSDVRHIHSKDNPEEAIKQGIVDMFNEYKLIEE